ncbi:MAG: hypothetical protein HKO94_07750, partial [Flavobacteriaceae bacterium]|nr:hypothetical protein [Flavobacteriaceae bacterium]
SPDDVGVSPGKPDERVDILMRYNGKLDQKPIMLPHVGSSDLAEFTVSHRLAEECTFEIFAFHKNRLFQHIGVSVYFCNHPNDFAMTPKMKIEMINMLRGDLSDFTDKKKYGSSIVFSDGLPIISKDLKIQELANEADIKQFNDGIRYLIEDYVKSEKPDDEKLILALADEGRVFYQTVLKRDWKFDENPVQIISSTTSHFPLEFAYIGELGPQVKSLCDKPKVQKALEEGKCCGCNKNGLKYICPLGFLSLRTIIERHRVGENVGLLKNRQLGIVENTVSLNRPPIPFMGKTVVGTSVNVDKVVSGLRSEVCKTIDKYSKQSREVKNWKEWLKAIEDDPDSLVIIGHVESAELRSRDSLEIGNDPITKRDLTDSYLRQESSTIQPIVILIGCNTQDVNMSFMDFAQLFKSMGAAIVLSTFTKIRGSQAAPLVNKLFTILSVSKGEEIRFGEAILKLRRALFAEGMYVSMAMVSHGDADWKLKL